jgi:hypothetical protein
VAQRDRSAEHVTRSFEIPANLMHAVITAKASLIS